MPVKRIFDDADQQKFANCSGDYNPLHIDYETAKRTMFGKQVVHGMHLLLWVLDMALADTKYKKVRSIKCRFLKVVTIGRPVEAEWGLEEDRLRVLVRTDAGKAVSADVVFDCKGKSSAFPAVIYGSFVDKEVQCFNVENRGAEYGGSVALQLDVEKCGLLFPALLKNLDHNQLATLFALTRVVGMLCPGRDALFSGFDVELPDKYNGRADIGYFVQKYDPRFNLVSISINSASLQGRVTSFLRPGPVKQPSFASLQPRVHAGEFKGVKALVVGGSRGLGEVAVKLLVAGGGDVRFTYSKGDSDSKKIVNEISREGATCSCHKLDVLQMAPDLENVLGDAWAPNCLLYFATPPIFQASREEFSNELFTLFMRFYVDFFLEIVVAIKKRIGDLPLVVLYPSSVAVEELPRDMKEYAVAKSAGEEVGRKMEGLYDNLRIISPQFPRLMTDQTASIYPVDNLDPVDPLLQVLRIAAE